MKISTRQNSQSGIALIIVMLVILVLATLAGAFAYSMKVETTLARNGNNESELEWLGRSGVELARYVIAEQAKVPGEGNYESLNQKWAGGPGGIGMTNSSLSGISLENNQLGAGTFSVKITDLERKFNINMANQDVLQQAMIVLMGVDASLFPTISDSILDWIDKDEDNHLSGAESDYYMGLDPPYMAKNGPMDDISELLLIKGIFENPEIYWGSSSTNHPASAFLSRNSGRPFDDPQRPSYPVGLVDIFTTLSSGKINVNTASATTLQMIPNVDENFAAGIVQLRSGPDGADGTEDDIPLQNTSELVNVPGANRELVRAITRYCGVRSSTFEVQVDVQLGNVTRQYFAVIRRGARQGDFGILKFYWK
jgi:general secretion pathway protein K